MKKGIWIILFLLLCLAVFLGAKALRKDKADSLQIVTCNIQTSHWEEGLPAQYVLDTKEEFAKFNEEHFHIAEDEAFQQEIGVADGAFFDKYILFCALVDAGSGSDQYAVSSVKMLENGEWEMAVSQKIAETGTCDMAEWFLFARIDRESMEAVPEQFDLRIAF